ncbi:MAG: hypothetical protein L0338_39070, partial [Acidobacteria bacterium]|nr:hypothetical protein [Acidobacteriota bacterium]
RDHRARVLQEGRLTTEEWIEARILIDRLLGARSLLIELLGIEWYVGGQRTRRSGAKVDFRTRPAHYKRRRIAQEVAREIGMPSLSSCSLFLVGRLQPGSTLLYH